MKRTSRQGRAFETGGSRRVTGAGAKGSRSPMGSPSARPPGTRSGFIGEIAGTAPGVAASVLVAGNVARALDRPLTETAPAGYRYWEDFAAAVTIFRAATPPADGRPAVPGAFATDFEAAESEIRRLDLRPWQ